MSSSLGLAASGTPEAAVDQIGRSGVAVIQQELPRGFDMIDLKTIAAGATIAGALGLTALGMGLGVANAAPPSPVTSGTPWPQDKPHGDGHGHDGDWHGGDWGGGPWHGGPGWYPGIDACVSATGPFGYVTGSVCI